MAEIEEFERQVYEAVEELLNDIARMKCLAKGKAPR